MIENKNDKFFIHDVLHKAFIEVDEKGSKAAAVATVSFGVKSIATIKNQWLFNRPFLYTIMDKKHKIPLFTGRVIDPSGQNQLKQKSKNATTNRVVTKATSTTATTTTTSTATTTSNKVGNCMANGNCNGQDSLTISWTVIGTLLLLSTFLYEI